VDRLKTYIKTALEMGYLVTLMGIVILLLVIQSTKDFIEKTLFSKKKRDSNQNLQRQSSNHSIIKQNNT
jgi:hypothetical protein